jgi:thiol:disulfide interchange protein
MRISALLGLLLLALVAAPTLSAQEAEAEEAKAEEAKGVQWTEDYSAALETAKSEEKLLFLEFTAVW